MDQQRAKERILETENLTDALEDEDADWLLNWGIAHIPDVLKDTHDEEAAGEKVNALMAVMRELNTITADRAAQGAPALAEKIQKLTEAHRQAFGHAPQVTPEAAKQVASTLAEKSPHEALETLIDFLSGPAPTAENKPGPTGEVKGAALGGASTKSGPSKPSDPHAAEDAAKK